MTGSVLVLNAADLDAARAVMRTLPMARAGMLDFTLTELLPLPPG